MMTIILNKGNKIRNNNNPVQFLQNKNYLDIMKGKNLGYQKLDQEKMRKVYFSENHFKNIL